MAFVLLRCAAALCMLVTQSSALAIRAADSTSPQYPEPEPCQGNCSTIHDPSVYYVDDTYWRFSTGGNIAIATAPSLSGPWEYQGALLTNGTQIPISNNSDNVWAPFVTKFKDTYYCYYAVSLFGTQTSDIGVATSTSLEPGSWQDHGSIGIPDSSRYNKIDPYVYQEDDEDPIYFLFGSYWTGIQQMKMDSHQGSGGNDLTNWTRPGQDIYNVIRNSTENFPVVEAPALWKNGEFYYIFYSVGECCNQPPDLVPAGNEYHIVVCRAEAATGPYYDKEGNSCRHSNGGTTILASHGDVYAPGGQELMEHPESGRTVMSYHYVRPSIGYSSELFQFGYNYLDWQDGWPVVVTA